MQSALPGCSGFTSDSANRSCGFARLNSSSRCASMSAGKVSTEFSWSTSSECFRMSISYTSAACREYSPEPGRVISMARGSNRQSPRIQFWRNTMSAKTGCFTRCRGGRLRSSFEFDDPKTAPGANCPGSRESLRDLGPGHDLYPLDCCPKPLRPARPLLSKE